MTQSANDRKLGRFLSLVLRHDPSAAGIFLDQHGWADVEELLNGIRQTGRQIDMETLERIVQENNKQRYSFNGDHTRIRANQGALAPGGCRVAASRSFPVSLPWNGGSFPTGHPSGGH